MAFYGTTVFEDGALAMVVEFCNKGALVDVLYGSKPLDLTVSQCVSIAQGTAAGVAHLHNQGIIHRDLAARNVLLHGSKSFLTPKVS